MNHAMNNQNPSLLKPGMGAFGEHGGQIITVTRINDLVREIDSTVQLDEEVEDTLLQMTDDFVDQVMNGAVMLAKHRHSTNSVEVKDVELYLGNKFITFLFLEMALLLLAIKQFIYNKIIYLDDKSSIMNPSNVFVLRLQSALLTCGFRVSELTNCGPINAVR